MLVFCCLLLHLCGFNVFSVAFFKVIFYSTPSTERKYAYMLLCFFYSSNSHTHSLINTLYIHIYALSNWNLRTPARHAVILGLLYPISCQRLTNTLLSHIFKKISAENNENTFINFIFFAYTYKWEFIYCIYIYLICVYINRYVFLVDL